MFVRACDKCGAEFIPKRPWARWCSQKCKSRVQTERREATTERKAYKAAWSRRWRKNNPEAAHAWDATYRERPGRLDYLRDYQREWARENKESVKITKARVQAKKIDMAPAPDPKLVQMLLTMREMRVFMRDTRKDAR